MWLLTRVLWGRQPGGATTCLLAVAAAEPPAADMEAPLAAAAAATGRRSAGNPDGFVRQEAQMSVQGERRNHVRG